MTLEYLVTQPLAIPEAAFTAIPGAPDIAKIIVSGGSYGGMWVMNAVPTHVPPDEVVPIGSIQTGEAKGQPEVAYEAASDWLREACAVLGFKLVHAESLNGQYGPAEAPFFSSGLFLID